MTTASLTDENITDKASLLGYLDLHNRRMGHYPMTVGVFTPAFHQIIRECNAEPDMREIDLYINGVKIINMGMSK